MSSPKKLTKQLETLPASIWATIAQIEELRGRWTGSMNLHPQILGRLKKSVLVTSTGSSTRIEGSEMSDEDIEKMLKGISIQTFNDRDTQEVQGYYELLQNVFESWETIPFNESTIKHFHAELLKYGEKDILHRGNYKSSENKVHMVNEKGESLGILFDTTPAYLTPSEMVTLIEWTRHAFENKEFHPLLVIANFILEFLSIHPFTDGNGRLSRILTNLLMLQHGYSFIPYVSHEKIIEDNKPDYYLALRNSQKTRNTKSETIMPWLTFFTTVVKKQAQQAIELLSKNAYETILSEKQLAALTYIQKQTFVTPRQIAQVTGIARPTVNQILQRLLQLKLIERVGLGRATRYRKV